MKFLYRAHLDQRLCQVPISTKVVALACSEPPAGAKHWSVVLLTQAAREHPEMRGISRETIRRFLKKPPQTLAEGDVVRGPADRGIPEPDGGFARTVRSALWCGRAG
ncbi:MAG: hypothetical protein ACREU8_02620, partial [Gammaproteobacteria bacterium]